MRSNNMKINNQIKKMTGNKEAFFIVLDDDTTFKFKGCTMSSLSIDFGDEIDITSLGDNRRMFMPVDPKLTLHMRPEEVEIVEGYYQKQTINWAIDEGLERALDF